MMLGNPTYLTQRNEQHTMISRQKKIGFKQKGSPAFSSTFLQEYVFIYQNNRSVIKHIDEIKSGGSSHALISTLEGSFGKTVRNLVAFTVLNYLPG